jgi:hypothetical protein
MLPTLIILAACLVLLLYWGRYTCLLLIQSEPSPGPAGGLAEVYRLAFPRVQRALEEQPDRTTLDALERSLASDYRILLYLLRHSPGLELGAAQRKLLMADYRLMQVWYRVVRRASPEEARMAVLEMSQVLGYFSQKMGERAAQQAVA